MPSRMTGGRGTGVSEQVDGESFPECIKFYYPQGRGAYAISERSMTVMRPTSQSRARRLCVFRLCRFQAVIPDAAQTLDPFVSAQRLVVHQEIKPSRPIISRSATPYPRHDRSRRHAGDAVAASASVRSPVKKQKSLSGTTGIRG